MNLAAGTSFPTLVSNANKALGWSMYGVRDTEVGYTMADVVGGASSAAQDLKQALRIGSDDADAVAHATAGVDLIERGIAASASDATAALALFTSAESEVYEAWKACAS